MRPVSGSVIQWSAFGSGVLLAGLLWGVDVQAFLWPPGADKIIWFPIVVLWIEIGIIVGALIRRYLAGRPALGRSPIVFAWGAAVINFTSMWILAPGLIFAP
jgi:hypothetical protein